MMALAELLQEFGDAMPSIGPVALAGKDGQDEQAVLQYEKGYDAGWEDALTLQIKEKGQISETLKSNLEDVDFTMAEARMQVLGSLEPVFQILIDRVLPDIMTTTLGDKILEAIQQLTSETVDTSLQLRVAPGQLAVIQPLLKQALGEALPLVEDPSLNEDQILISTAAAERLIDPSGILGAISTALAGFHEVAKSEAQND